MLKKRRAGEFLVLMEDAIRTPDISKSVQRYQLAIDEAKVRLDFVTSPGSWLMPSRMVINTESTIGYNNQLKQATPDTKLGVNNLINMGTKKASLKPMDGRPSKINPPNPIHKKAMEALGVGEKKSKKASVMLAPMQTEAPQTNSEIEPHHINKAIIAVAVVLARLVVWKRYRLRLIVFSIKNAATARIRSQAFLPRKEITRPAVRNAKLTIKPSRPGRMEPIFFA